MLTHLKKAAITAALVTLAPIAPLMFGTASDASAHTYVSGSVTFGGPVAPIAVLGYSYGNPYQYGPVYYEPEACDVGPVYYYPQYRVYAPRYAAFSYYRYARPRYYYPRHQSYAPGYGRYIRGHAYGHDRGYYGRDYDRRDYRDRDCDRDRRDYGRGRVRGHYSERWRDRD